MYLSPTTHDWQLVSHNSQAMAIPCTNVAAERSPVSHYVFMFPEDIAREILELSARAHRDMAPQLIKLNRQVQRWIEPVLYETVHLVNILKALRFIYAIRTKPPALFTRVKYLTISFCVGTDLAYQIIPHCPRVRELACWVPNVTSIPGFTNLNPQHLLMHLNSGNDSGRMKPDFGQVLYSSVTRLAFTDPCRVWTHWEGFSKLSNLTHLKLEWVYPCPFEYKHILSDILHSCKHLKILLLMLGLPMLRDPVIAIPSGLDVMGDPRVVVIQMNRVFLVSERADGTNPRLWKKAEEILSAQYEKVRVKAK
ncbi:hypothetical protein HGRIS_012699 [Hohenbuehelia grisea]|uniref:F-box protein n=1 Tax=Hohenbuehelia grisea TaxID=104357 RepID=A0ABR3IT62_9AGAR